jgi:hypothetical protein
MAKAHPDDPKYYQIYDELKRALLNKKYYGMRLETFRSRNIVMEWMILAGASGSGLAGLAVWGTPYGKPVWGAITAVSALLALAKPLLKMSDKIATYAKLYGDYTGTYEKLRILSDDIQVTHALSTATSKTFHETRKAASELSGLGDPYPDRELVKKLQDQVNAEISLDNLWIPSDDIRADVSPVAIVRTQDEAVPNAETADDNGRGSEKSSSET